MANGEFFIVGGAGFIGSHFVDRLLKRHGGARRVRVFDNFSSGREWHIEPHIDDGRFSLIRGDAKDLDLLTRSMTGHSTVIHLASNPDIVAAASDPDIDFREGTALTRNVVEAMRKSGAKSILYASGSGVYGDLGEHEAAENYGPSIPVSTYGASKQAGEGLLSSYSFMFDLTAIAFRFGNVVGPRQTHGVGFDFLRKLSTNPNSLKILGDGTQSKSYIHVHDVIDAVLLAHERAHPGFHVFNVATGDYITVREIADIAADILGIDPASIKFEFSGGSRGWKGDVPIVRLNTDRIREIGWQHTRSSREALIASMKSMLDDAVRLWG